MQEICIGLAKNQKGLSLVSRYSQVQVRITDTHKHYNRVLGLLGRRDKFKMTGINLAEALALKNCLIPVHITS